MVSGSSNITTEGFKRMPGPIFYPTGIFTEGGTNAKGNEIKFELGVAKHVTLGLDYYFDVKPIKGNTDNTG